MYFATQSLFIFNFVVIIVRDVSSQDNQKSKIELEEMRRQEQHFDYWEIDHNEASAIYYEPADLFTEKPFDLSKKFFISNPSAEASLYSLDKTHSSTTKEKRNLLTQNADTTELCVNDSAVDEGTNVFLDVNLATSPTLRNADNEELTAELSAIEDIKSTEEKIVECIDLHLFKNRDVIENWQLLLSESKIKMYSLLTEMDIDKEIQGKCKHLENIIEYNLDLLKRSTPKRNKINITTISTTEKVSARKADRLFTKEENTATDSFINTDQTENPLSDLSTDSTILASQYPQENVSDIPNNKSVLNEKPVTDINNINTDTTKQKSSELLSKYPSNSSMKKSQNIPENYKNNRRFDTLDSKPKRNQGREMAYNESEINIPKILTKELLNGSVISEANGTETLPNDDFKEFDTVVKETISNCKENASSTDNLYIYETTEEKLYEETTPTGGDNNESASYLGTEPTPHVNYSDPFIYTPASTETVLPPELDLANQNNITHSFINNNRRYMGKWSGGNNSVDEENTESTSTRLVYETNTDKNDILSENQVDDPRSTSKGTPSSSLNGTLYFDFNGKLVPTHFVQNAEGSIHIAIEGKSFCDSVLDKLQSVILQAICKSNYATSNSNEAKTNKP